MGQSRQQNKITVHKNKKIIPTPSSKSFKFYFYTENNKAHVLFCCTVNLSYTFSGSIYIFKNPKKYFWLYDNPRFINSATNEEWYVYSSYEV